MRSYAALVLLPLLRGAPDAPTRCAAINRLLEPNAWLPSDDTGDSSVCAALLSLALEGASSTDLVSSAVAVLGQSAAHLQAGPLSAPFCAATLAMGAALCAPFAAPLPQGSAADAQAFARHFAQQRRALAHLSTLLQPLLQGEEGSAMPALEGAWAIEASGSAGRSAEDLAAAAGAACAASPLAHACLALLSPAQAPLLAPLRVGLALQPLGRQASAWYADSLARGAGAGAAAGALAGAAVAALLRVDGGVWVYPAARAAALRRVQGLVAEHAELGVALEAACRAALPSAPPAARCMLGLAAVEGLLAAARAWGGEHVRRKRVGGLGAQAQGLLQGLARWGDAQDLGAEAEVREAAAAAAASEGLFDL